MTLLLALLAPFFVYAFVLTYLLYFLFSSASLFSFVTIFSFSLSFSFLSLSLCWTLRGLRRRFALTGQPYYKGPLTVSHSRILQEHFPLRFTKPQLQSLYPPSIFVASVPFSLSPGTVQEQARTRPRACQKQASNSPAAIHEHASARPEARQEHARNDPGTVQEQSRSSPRASQEQAKSKPMPRTTTTERWPEAYQEKARSLSGASQEQAIKHEAPTPISKQPRTTQYGTIWRHDDDEDDDDLH